ncbi:hypothetical protein D3C80_1696440 [compost metagenome]
MKVLERGGTAMRAACGNITRHIAWGQLMPMECAASHCPLGMAARVARMISEL